MRETIPYDFGFESHHGIFRTLPVRYSYDDTQDRVVEVSNVTVSSPTGAPTNLDLSEAGGVLTIKIGDPDQTVTGHQTYVIDYDVRGAMNVFSDHDEVFWNAIGPEWAIPIQSATVVVHTPAAPTQVVCYAGPAGSALPCTTASKTDSGASFTQDQLEPYEGLTVAVAMPKGSVDVPPPILAEKFSLERAFSFTPLTVGGALAVLLAGLAGVGWFAWTRGRDRRWRGQVPGLNPAIGQPDDDSLTERRPLFTGPEGAVEFAVPDGVRPGQVGTLIDEQANPLDVTATIVDLAVRGYLRIEELPRGQLPVAPGLEAHAAQAVRRRADALRAHPARRAVRRPQRGAGLRAQAHVRLRPVKVESQLYDDMVRQGWYRRRPDTTRQLWFVAGIVCVLLGAGLTYLLARYTHAGLVGIAAVLGGVALLVVAGACPRAPGRVRPSSRGSSASGSTSPPPRPTS